MAYNYCNSLIAFLCIFNILLAMTGQAFAGRYIPTDSKKTDMKQPEWFIGSDGSYLIPGIGRVMWPPLDGSGGSGGTFNPVGGSTGDDIPSGNPVWGSSGGYIPGGDDTIVPNPGAEVPNPDAGAGGIIPTTPSP